MHSSSLDRVGFHYTPAPVETLPDPREVLNSIGGVVYDWDLTSDRMVWGSNVDQILGASARELHSGRSFSDRLAGSEGAQRREAIVDASTQDRGAGVRYQMTYQFQRRERLSGALTAVTVEDAGRWFAGSDARPARAHGVLRVLPAGSLPSVVGIGRADPLTGAADRTQLVAHLTRLCEESQRERTTFGVIFASVGQLSDINREHGYDAADRLLTQLADVLRTNIRATDFLARYGGAKFVLVLDACDTEQLRAAAQRFTEVVAEHCASGQMLPIHLCMGGLVAPRHGRTAHAILQNAREALERARQPGMPAYIAYAPDYAAEEARRRSVSIADEIVAALNEGRVALAYQPIVRSATGEPAFYEALLRMRRDDGTLAATSDILPIAEKTGLITLLDQRVLELAVQRLLENPALTLSVNVSAATVQDSDWPHRVGALIRQTPALASRLIIEITETCAIANIEATRRTIGWLKKLGLRVAMDDFGAGHTSFRNLRDLAPDLIKIDGAFVQNLARSTDDAFFVRTLSELAHFLQVPVVAEWVEDAETVAMLRGWGVEYLQGHHFGEAIDMPGGCDAGQPLSVAC